MSDEDVAVPEEDLPKSLVALPPVANPLIPRLVDLCVETIISNFKECSKLHLIPKKYRTKILQKIPQDLDLTTQVLVIPDGIYWKRICLAKFPGISHDPNLKEWKRFYLEKLAGYELENATEDNVAEVFESLRIVGPFIKEITLSRCPSKISIKKLFNIFRGLRKLTLVYGEPRKNFAQYEEFDTYTLQKEMSATQVDCVQLQKDFESVGSFCALEEFDMTDNSLTDKCAQIIGLGLVHLKRLTSLTFAHNEIGNFGFQHICQCLKSAPIRYLNVSDNKIGSDGCLALVNACEKNNTLETLNLSSNQLGDDGLFVLSRIVEKTTSLKFLDISGNRISKFGPLAEALAKNKSLKELITAANPINPEDLQILGEVASKSETLDKVDFRDYQLNEEDYIIKTTETSEAPLLRIK